MDAMKRRAREIDRFARLVAWDGTCLVWIGNVASTYGQFWHEGKSVRAHRWAYEHFVGPIPDGLVIDHFCRNRLCVWWPHLEAVTQAVNNERQARFASDTCKRGHPKEGNRRPDRKCRICHRDLMRARKRN